MSASLEKTFQRTREPVAAPKRVNICLLGPGPPPNVDAKLEVALKVFLLRLIPSRRHSGIHAAWGSRNDLWRLIRRYVGVRIGHVAQVMIFPFLGR